MSNTSDSPASASSRPGRRIRCRFTPEEFDSVTRAAKARGLTPSQYMRQCALALRSQLKTLASSSRTTL
jgi:uncharacterized protein (DUF1778 family)